MRTRNHFCLGEGYKGFHAVLSGHYPVGRVAVLCEDLAEGQALAATLLKTHKVTLLSVEDREQKKEDVRFVIGIGSPEIVLPVKKYAEGVPFAFFAKTIDYRFLNAFDGTKKLSEFVFFDAITPPEECFFAAYSALFSLWCESYIRKLEESCFPYADRELTGLTSSAERVLKGECDKGEFLPECLRLISVLCNAFSRYGKLYVETASLLGDAPEERFLSSYLLLNLFKTFTNIPYRAILNPTAERKDRHAYDPAVLPDQEISRTFIRRMKAMRELPDVDTEEFISLLSLVCSPELPLLCALNERGLLKGRYYEEFTRDRGVSV